MTAEQVSERIDRAKCYVLSIGGSAVDITVSILLLVLVGRAYGPEGLGVYSFLLSVFIIVSFLADPGVGKYVEREFAVGNRSDMDDLLLDTKCVILLAGLVGIMGTLLLGKWVTDVSSIAKDAWPICSIFHTF